MNEYSWKISYTQFRNTMISNKTTGKHGLTMFVGEDACCRRWCCSSHSICSAERAQPLRLMCCGVLCAPAPFRPRTEHQVRILCKLVRSCVRSVDRHTVWQAIQFEVCVYERDIHNIVHTRMLCQWLLNKWTGAHMLHTHTRIHECQRQRCWCRFIEDVYINLCECTHTHRLHIAAYRAYRNSCVYDDAIVRLLIYDVCVCRRRRCSRCSRCVLLMKLVAYIIFMKNCIHC